MYLNYIYSSHCLYKNKNLLTIMILHYFQLSLADLNTILSWIIYEK